MPPPHSSLHLETHHQAHHHPTDWVGFHRISTKVVCAVCRMMGLPLQRGKTRLFYYPSEIHAMKNRSAMRTCIDEHVWGNGDFTPFVLFLMASLPPRISFLFPFLFFSFPFLFLFFFVFFLSFLFLSFFLCVKLYHSEQEVCSSLLLKLCIFFSFYFAKLWLM